MIEIFKVTDKIKTNNARYTQECLEVYKNLTFAYIKRMRLSTAMILYMYIFLFLVLVAGILSLFFGKGSLGVVGGTIISVVMITFFTVLTTVTVVCFKHNIAGIWQCYILRDKNGMYEMDVEDVGGKLYVKNIRDKKRHKQLSVNGEDCSIIYFEGELLDDIGLIQYVVSPKNVAHNLYLERGYARPVDENLDLYKKKRVVGNTTYYYFRSFGPVMGAVYPRCVKLKNGVIKHVTTQEGGFWDARGKFVFSSYKYTYTHVNDRSVKIYVSRYAKEYAEKHKFVLPLECENICYEDS